MILKFQVPPLARGSGLMSHEILRTYSSLKKCSFFALLMGITGVHLFSSGLPFDTTSLCNLNKCSKVKFPRKISLRAIEHARSSIRFLSWNLFWTVVIKMTYKLGYFAIINGHSGYKIDFGYLL